MEKIIRLDDRLIHGQTINNWCTFYKIDEIILVNKAVKGDYLRRTIIEMSVPSNIRLKIFDVDDLLKENLKRINKKLLIIFGDVFEVYEFIRGGGEIESLNVGGICYKVGREKFRPTVYLNKEEAKILNKLVNDGVEVEVRILPLDKKKSLFN